MAGEKKQTYSLDSLVDKGPGTYEDGKNQLNLCVWLNGSGKATHALGLQKTDHPTRKAFWDMTVNKKYRQILFRIKGPNLFEDVLISIERKTDRYVIFENGKEIGTVV